MTIRSFFLLPDGRLRPTWRFLLFIPLFIALVFGASVLLSALLPAPILDGEFEQQQVLGGLVTCLSTWLASWLALRWMDRRSIRTVGLWFYEGWGRELLLGLAGGVVLISVVVAIQLAAGAVRFAPGQVTAGGTLAALGWYSLLFLPAAAFEEFAFRGYPFQRLLEGWGEFVAVFFLSVLFGLVHLGNPNPTVLSTVNTVLAGILLAVAYLRTRGLWLPIGLHFTWNFWMAAVLSLPVSGIELKTKLLRVELSGPEWLSGGAYGPEGSVVCTVVLTAATVWLVRTRLLTVSSQMAKELQ